MPCRRPEEVTDRAVRGDGVRARHTGAEPEAALGVRREQSAAVARRLDVGLLDVVVALGVRLPDVEDRAGQRSAVLRQHASADHARLAAADQVDVRAEFPDRGLGHVERAEDRRLRHAAAPVALVPLSALVPLVVPLIAPAVPAASVAVDRLDQHRDTEDVRQQDELLPRVRAGPPGRREEGDRLLPLRRRRLGLAHEGVQVAGEGGEQLAQARVGRAVEAVDDRLGDPGGEFGGHAPLLRLFTRLRHG